MREERPFRIQSPEVSVRPEAVPLTNRCRQSQGDRVAAHKVNTPADVLLDSHVLGVPAPKGHELGEDCDESVCRRCCLCFRSNSRYSLCSVRRGRSAPWPWSFTTPAPPATPHAVPEPPAADNASPLNLPTMEKVGRERCARRMTWWRI